MSPVSSLIVSPRENDGGRKDIVVLRKLRRAMAERDHGGRAILEVLVTLELFTYTF